MALIREHDPFSGHRLDLSDAVFTPLDEHGQPVGVPVSPSEVTIEAPPAWISVALDREPPAVPPPAVPEPAEPPVVEKPKPARRRGRRRPSRAELDQALREME